MPFTRLGISEALSDEEDQVAPFDAQTVRQLAREMAAKPYQRADGRMPRALGILLTLIAVLFGWALFYQTDLHACSRQMLAMVGISRNGGISFAGWMDATTLQTIRTYTVFPLLAAALSIPILPTLERFLRNRVRLQRTAQLLSVVLLTLGVVLCIMNLVSDSYNPFLYFRF